jgi:hypothetical protein
MSKLTGYQWSGMFPDQTVIIENDEVSLDQLAQLPLAQLVLVPRSGQHHGHVPIVVDVGKSCGWYVAVQRSTTLNDNGRYHDNPPADVVVLQTPSGALIRLIIHPDGSIRLTLQGE